MTELFESSVGAVETAAREIADTLDVVVNVLDRLLAAGVLDEPELAATAVAVRDVLEMRVEQWREIGWCR